LRTSKHALPNHHGTARQRRRNGLRELPHQQQGWIHLAVGAGRAEPFVQAADRPVNKVTIKGAKQAVQMFGPAQHAAAKAVADSVADGVIPQDEAENLLICVSVFIYWEAADDKKSSSTIIKPPRKRSRVPLAASPRFPKSSPSEIGSSTLCGVKRPLQPRELGPNSIQLTLRKRICAILGGRLRGSSRCTGQQRRSDCRASRIRHCFSKPHTALAFSRRAQCCSRHR